MALLEILSTSGGLGFYTVRMLDELQGSFWQPGQMGRRGFVVLSGTAQSARTRKGSSTD